MFPELTRDDVFRIETRRLWLRWPRVADAAAIARYAGEKAVAEMTATITSPFTEQQSTVVVLAGRQANTDGQGLYLAITPQARPNDAIGAISVFPREEGEPVLGYWLAQPCWGQGLATEAAHAMVDLLFGLTAARALRASIAPANGASRRVLKKCGFAHIGGGMSDAPARGGPQAVDHYRLDRATWVSLKGWREPRFSPDVAMAGAAS